MAKRRKSNSQHSFAKVPGPNIPRSVFNRSHGYKTTFNAGDLIPIYVDEALPGDVFRLKLTSFIRTATLLYPIMDNMYADVFFFAVPNRLLWDNWEKFNGAQDNPGDTTDYLLPNITIPDYADINGTIYDYMGIPPQATSQIPQGEGLYINALPLRAYNLIYNEYFRDENLQDSLTITTGDGPDSHLSYSILKRGKRRDYFTSALPWPQKGDQVLLPLGDSAPVVPDATGVPYFQDPAGTETTALKHRTGTPGNVADDFTTAVTDNVELEWSATGLQADLTNATAATINQLRQAFQIQRLFERDARGGTRYTEILRSHFGVISPDARLQRPEYLGGGRFAVNVNPVASTAPVTDAPQANLAAFGTAAGGAGFKKYFTEHCTLIGLISIRADYTYQQGINRMWRRRTRYDFYWPALSHLGEQAVDMAEIYATGDPANDDLTFGYQERYAEYRYKPSLITGQFRSDHQTPLDAWHLSQYFASPPVLGDTFIQEDPPVDRVIAVPSEPQFLLDAHIQMKCARPMPVYSVPGLIDHF